jgi:hypothetical protein
MRASVEEFIKLPVAERAKFKVVKGHMYFGLHEFLPQPCTYVTLLREPIDRVVSHYYYVLRSPDHYLHDIVTSENMGLVDYVQRGIALEMDNGQTRVLAGLSAEEVVGNLAYVSSVPFGACSEEIFRMAKANLANFFAVVGLAERFDETLVLLNHTFGWRFPFYSKRNVASDRPSRRSLSEDTRAVLRQYNRWDIQLYDCAKHLFAEAVRQYGDRFERDLRRFTLLNRPFSSPIVDTAARFLWRGYKGLTGE